MPGSGGAEFGDFFMKVLENALPLGAYLIVALLLLSCRGALAEWWAESVFIYRRRLLHLERQVIEVRGESMDYTAKVMEHFQNPHNVGEVENADGVGTVGNPVCGDMMKITIKVAAGKITDCKFKTLGCGAAIATSSITTDMAKGLTLTEGEQLTREQVAAALDGLPPEKMHCSNLAADGLHAAIKDYFTKHPEAQS
jgi:nitrogen fixation NifU-like protein